MQTFMSVKSRNSNHQENWKKQTNHQEIVPLTLTMYNLSKTSDKAAISKGKKQRTSSLA